MCALNVRGAALLFSTCDAHSFAARVLRRTPTEQVIRGNSIMLLEPLERIA